MRGLRFFFAVLLASSLACQTLLGGGATASPLAFSDTKPTRMPSPTPTTAPPPITRLSGEDLPILEFGPPGKGTNESGRPRLSAEGFTLDSDHFRIHYTQEGDDAVPKGDANANEQPDYVEEVARALEFAWYAEIEYFGWAAPPSDETMGGDDRYDIYLLNILEGDYAGYTDSDQRNSVVGDNPNSPLVEENATRSFIVLDNDYAEYEESRMTGISLLEYMHSVAAHEFNHAIQFGYDGQEPHEWLWEATATWMEDEVFDNVNETVGALPSVFKSPDTCQLAEGGEKRVEDSDHWYGMWILMRYLSERHSEESVRRIWELAVSLDGYDVWDAMLQEKETTLELFFTDFSIALLTRDFQEGDSYPTIRLEGKASAVEAFVPADGVEQMAMEYVELVGKDIYTVRLDNPEMTGVIVGIHNGESFVFPLENNETTINLGDFEHTYLIVLNLDRALGPGNCRPKGYTISMESGGVPEEAVYTLPAAHFQLPRVEQFHDPEEGQ